MQTPKQFPTNQKLAPNAIARLPMLKAVMTKYTAEEVITKRGSIKV